MFTLTMWLPFAKNVSTFPGKGLIREFGTGRAIRKEESRPGQRSILHIYMFILKGLAKIYFPSVDSLRTEVMIPGNMVLRQLTNFVELKC
jgi:hypothetical protein